LYPYLAMIFAATPNPGFFSELVSLVGGGGTAFKDGELKGVGDELEAGLEVSVREGGGAIAAPPEEVAVEKQSQLVGLK